jgi:hypothetical protein
MKFFKLIILVVSACFFPKVYAQNFKILEKYESEEAQNTVWYYLETEEKIDKDSIFNAVQNFRKNTNLEVRTTVFYLFKKNSGHFATLKSEHFMGMLGLVDTTCLMGYDNFHYKLNEKIDSASVVNSMRINSKCLRDRESGLIYESFALSGMNLCTVAWDNTRKGLFRVDWMGGPIYAQDGPIMLSDAENEMGYTVENGIKKIYSVNRFGDLMIKKENEKGWFDVRKRVK